MTASSTNAAISARLLRQVDLFLAAMGQGFDAYLERRSRMDEIARLNAKSDEDLRRMGLTRDRIPHHVFRDAFVL